MHRLRSHRSLKMRTQPGSLVDLFGAGRLQDSAIASRAAAPIEFKQRARCVIYVDLSMGRSQAPAQGRSPLDPAAFLCGGQSVGPGRANRALGDSGRIRTERPPEAARLAGLDQVTEASEPII